MKNINRKIEKFHPIEINWMEDIKNNLSEELYDNLFQNVLLDVIWIISDFQNEISYTFNDTALIMEHHEK